LDSVAPDEPRPAGDDPFHVVGHTPYSFS
jgi:hypothetical protein